MPIPIKDTRNASHAVAGLNSTSGRRRTILRIAGLQALTERSQGDPGTRIALIDGRVAEGVRLGSIVIGGEGPSTSSPRARAHATHMASILTGRSPELLGLCPRVTLLSIAAVDDAMLDGTKSPAAVGTSLASAVAAAAAADPDVIVLGIALTGSGLGVLAPLRQEIAAAAARGIRTVIPVGNDGGPASGMLEVVGAIPVAFGDDASRLDPRNRWSPAVARTGFVAPGVKIPGLDPTGEVVFGTGSSFSAAIVAATYLLLRASVPDVPREAVWSAMRQSTGRQVRWGLPEPLDGEASYDRLVRFH